MPSKSITKRQGRGQNWRKKIITVATEVSATKQPSLPIIPELAGQLPLTQEALAEERRILETFRIQLRHERDRLRLVAAKLDYDKEHLAHLQAVFDKVQVNDLLYDSNNPVIDNRCFICFATTTNKLKCGHLIHRKCLTEGECCPVCFAQPVWIE